MKCENCSNEHDGSYGSGRFCSKHCRCSFNAKKQKHFATKEQLLKRKGFGAKSKETGWKCNKCNLIFRTRAELRLHLKEVKHLNNQGWNKGLTAFTSESIAKGKKTRHQHFIEGKFHGSFQVKNLLKNIKKRFVKVLLITL